MWTRCTVAAIHVVSWIFSMMLASIAVASRFVA